MYGNLGEIRIVAFNFIPKNFVLCDGRRFNKYKSSSSTFKTSLYEIVGDAYTYDESNPNTFAIPDLRNHFVRQPASNSDIGKRKGKDTVTLSIDQMPAHNHNVSVEADNSNGGEDPLQLPNNAFLNNNAGVFSSEPSEDTFLGGISQKNVGNSEPISIKNAHIKMVYVMCILYQNDGNPFIGEIRIWPNSKTGNHSGDIPNNWRLCNGDTLRTSQNTPLYNIIGTHYGGNIARNEYKLPDFRNKLAVCSQKASKVGETGGNTSVLLNKNQLPPHNHEVQLAVNNNADSSPHIQIPNNTFINSNAGSFSSEVTLSAKLGGISQENKGGSEDIDITNTSLGLNYIICVNGVFPGGIKGTLGEIRLFAGFDANPLTYFYSCYGQSLPISLNQSLFSLIGTLYGGDGRINMLLPNLKNKIPLCISHMSDLGKSGGANSIRLTSENLPAHNHNVQLAANNGADGRRVNIPDGILNKDAGMFSSKETENTYLGGIKQQDFKGEEIDLRNPFLAINYLICVDGDYPIRA